MALEDLTGTKYIDDLNSSNPAAGDNVSEGDDHIRGIKNVLKTTFPNIDGAVNATDTELNYVDGVTSAIQTQLGAKLPLAGGTMTGALDFGDNVKANFGATDDLQIYHDSGNSIIQDNGVGNLYIMGESSIRLTNNNAVNHYAKFNNGGSVDLYHNNSQKLSTTSTGIDVTGSVTADGLTVDGAADIEYQSGATNNTAPETLKVSNITTGVHAAGLGATIKFEHTNSSATYAGGKISNVSKADPYTSNLSFYPYNYGYTEAMTIDSSGNVGIGTTTPAQPLEISASNPAIKLSSTGTNGGILICNVNGTDKGFFGSSYHLISGGSSNNTTIRANGELQIATNGGYERMRIDSSGNVGIGNSSPPEMLTVGNTSDTYVRIQFLSSTTGGNTIHFGDGASADAYRGWINYTHSDDALAFGTGGVERMRIDSTGKVGIVGSESNQILNIKADSNVTGDEIGISFAGTTYAKARIVVENTNNGNAGGALKFYTGGWPTTTDVTEAMRIDSSGNLGIGATSPDEKLHIGGNLVVEAAGYAAGIYVMQKSIVASASQDIFTITNGNGAQVFQVMFNCSTSSYSVAKMYNVAHAYSETPVATETADTGDYGGNDFTVNFTDVTSNSVKCAITNDAASVTANITITLILGGSPAAVTLTKH